MIETLISSRTRIKLLMKFFLNSKNSSYLRGLEQEFGESSNAIRIELNRLEKAGMLVSNLKGNKKIFTANTTHPLFQEIHNIILKQIGVDRIIAHVIERLGDVERVFLVGEFSEGRDSQVIDLLIIGDVNKVYLIELVDKAEKLIKRKIRYIVYSSEEKDMIDWKKHNTEPLLVWSK